jgi:pilus assembly protein CpaE
MSNVLRLVIVDPKDTTREAIKSLLMGMDSVWLEAECSRYEFFVDVVGQTNPDIGLICIDHDPPKAIRLLEQLREAAPECALLVVSSSTDGQLILQAMRAGAKEFLTLPLKGEDLVTALDRVKSLRYGRGDAKSRSCKVIAVAGATGGVGCTSLAVNLGTILAKDPGNAVVLIDLDLSLGDADVFLDAIPDYTLVDIAQNISRLDLTLMKRSLTKHSSGLYLLPRPVQLQDASLVTPDDLQRVFGLLRAAFSHLIIDLSKAYGPVDMVALEAAHEILLVTQLDLPCLRNVVRLLTSFDEVEGMKDKVKIIVNRAGLDNGQISLKKAQETIGREIFWQLPNDYRLMVEVRNNGVPLIEQSPRASVTQAIVGLAEAISGSAPAEEPESVPPSGGWLKFWPGKFKTKSKP